MSHTVFCKKYQKDMEGLPTPPLPGPNGQDIYDNISKQAWQEWQARQIRLINEKQLSMINPEDRKYLMDQMALFFANEEADEADGFVPPEA
jgi:Fe-S cluster biosynthesis and repair protein YggX